MDIVCLITTCTGASGGPGLRWTFSVPQGVWGPSEQEPSERRARPAGAGHLIRLAGGPVRVRGGRAPRRGGASAEQKSDDFTRTNAI